MQGEADGSLGVLGAFGLDVDVGGASAGESDEALLRRQRSEFERAGFKDRQEELVGGQDVVVDERLHDVLGGQDGARDGLAGDLGPADHGGFLQAERGVGGGGQRQDRFIVLLGYRGAGGGEPLGHAAHFQIDLAVEAVEAEGLDHEDGGGPLADAGIVGRDADGEVGLRRPDDQAVGVLGPAFALEVADPHDVLAGLLELVQEVRVGVVGHVGFGLVDEVVVLGELFAGLVEERQQRVDGRAETAGADLQDEVLIGLGLEGEEVGVAGPFDAGVDGDGGREGLGLLGGIVGFLLGRVGQVRDAERHGVGDEVGVVEADESLVGALGRQVELHLVLRQVGAEEFHVDLGAAPSADGPDVRDERHGPDGEAIDEVAPAAEDGVADLDHVLAVGGHLEHQDRVGVEAEVVDVGDVAALGVVQGEDGLEPSGDAVGDEGQDVLGLDAQDERLAGLGGEAEEVFVGVEDLAVGQRGQGGQGLGLAEFGVGLLLGDLRHLADEEPPAVRGAAGRDEAEVAVAGRGVGGDGHRDGGGVLGLALLDLLDGARDAGAADVDGLGAHQVGPDDGHLDGGALLSAGRIDVGQVAGQGLGAGRTRGRQRQGEHGGKRGTHGQAAPPFRAGGLRTRRASKRVSGAARWPGMGCRGHRRVTSFVVRIAPTARAGQVRRLTMVSPAASYRAASAPPSGESACRAVSGPPSPARAWVFLSAAVAWGAWGAAASRVREPG